MITDAVVKEHDNDPYDVIIILGDLGYDLNDDFGELGDRFFNML